jgi:hydrogenase maturation protease
VVVVGVGNILFGDEGVGVYAAAYLRTAYSFDPQIEVADGAALGFSVMDFFEDGATVIVLDAVQADAPPATVYRLPTERLLDLGNEVTPTAHEVDPIQCLKRARAFGNDTEMVLIGMVPENTSDMAVGLTAPVSASFAHFCETAVNEIRAQGIEVRAVKDVSLAEVVQSLVTQPQ